MWQTLLADEETFARLVENPASEFYKSLSDEQKLVMQVLSVYGHPVPAAAVREMLPALPVDRILDRLVRNLAVAYDRGRFSLHSLDQQYAYSQIPDEGSDYSKPVLHQIASRFYKELEKPASEWTTIDDLEPQLQEFYHLVRAGLCDSACQVLDTIDGRYLRIWGHYGILIESREQMVGRLRERNLALSNLRFLGSAYAEIGRAREALQLLNGVLEEYSTELTPGAISGIHNVLGMAHESLGDYESAKAHYQGGLEIALQTSDRQLEATFYANLGQLYCCAGAPEAAIEHVTKALEMDRALENRREEGIDLGNLGFAYWMSGDPRAAFETHLKALDIACEVKDMMRQGIHQGNLGRCHQDLGDFIKAVETLSKAVDIARTVGDMERECLNTADLALACACLGETEASRSVISEGLAVSVRISYPRGQVRGLMCQGWLDLITGAAQDALTSYREAIDRARLVGDRFSLSWALHGVGVAQHRLGNLSGAHAALAEALDLGFLRNGYACTVRLGMLCLQANEQEQAGDHLAEGIRMCGDQAERSGALYDVLLHLGLAYLCLQRPDEALSASRQALEICSAKGIVLYALEDLRLLQACPCRLEALDAMVALFEGSLGIGP